MRSCCCRCRSRAAAGPQWCAAMLRRGLGAGTEGGDHGDKALWRVMVAVIVVWRVVLTEEALEVVEEVSESRCGKAEWLYAKRTCRYCVLVLPSRSSRSSMRSSDFWRVCPPKLVFWRRCWLTWMWARRKVQGPQTVSAFTC